MALVRIWIPTLRDTPSARADQRYAAFANSMMRLPMEAQQDLVGKVGGRLRTGMVPRGDFGIGFDESGEHAVIHVVPRRVGDGVTLPEAAEWIVDDGVMAWR
jgi:hypothetical protein